jgi:hypothetical protein
VKPALSAVEQDGPKYIVRSVYVLRPDGRDQLQLGGRAIPILPIRRDAVGDIAVSGGLVRVTLNDGRLLTIPLSVCILESVPEGS